MQNLKISKLSKQYNQPLLEEVDLTHSGNDLIALIGDNGCGKSTLLKILAGLEEVDGGKVSWGPEPRIGFMPQEIVDHPTLSGGQKKIALLSKLIYTNQNDVLLLDEPDNHLDAESKIWLEEALREFPGLVIYISHDRKFLKKTAEKIWLVEDGRIKEYPFGFAKFEETYSEYFQSQAKLYKLQEAEKKRLEAFVARMQRMATNVKGAKRYKAAKTRLSRFIDEMVDDPSSKTEVISIKSKQIGKTIKKKTAIFIKEMSFSYSNDEMIFKSARLHVFVGEKIALVAPNGTGKSTLIKLLINELEPTSGRAELGNNLKIGYYSQEHFANLPSDQTSLAIFQERYPIPDWQIESILRNFFFTKALTRTRIERLSGGQRSRLQLALFLYTNPDLLILDEPTNHLDLKSIMALERFLIGYEGTILLISHDEELVNNVCQTVYTLNGGEIDRKYS
jgi:ATP-binding cassette, subfamily F, member 3